MKMAVKGRGKEDRRPAAVGEGEDDGPTGGRRASACQDGELDRGGMSTRARLMLMDPEMANRLTHGLRFQPVSCFISFYESESPSIINSV